MAAEFRQLLQELVVPELKDLRSGVDRINVEIRRLDEKIDSFRNEMTTEIRRLDERVDGFDSKMTARFDALESRMDALDTRLTETIDIRERLAALEARRGRR